MTITNQNIKLYRGDTAQVAVTLTQADGSPFDPSINAVLKWRLTDNAHSSEDEAHVRKELGEGITLAAGGVINILLTAADTDLDPGLYYHELKIFDEGDVATAMTGFLVVRHALQLGSLPVPSQMALTTTAPVVS